MNLIILDDGHGIDTQGKRTPDGYLENDFNRKVIENLRYLLYLDNNYDVFLTSGEKYDVPLLERVDRANKAHKQFITNNPNSTSVLISVHYNAYGTTWNSANGIETYYNTSVDKPFADVIHDSLTKNSNQLDRGLKQAKFTILTGVMQSCLVECGFMTNKEESDLMKSDSFCKEVAERLYKGIQSFFGGSMKTESEIKYVKTSGGIHSLIGSPLDLDVAIVNCSNNKIPKTYKNYVNGTFFWYQDYPKNIMSYPTSILYANGKIYQNAANHFYDYGAPQSCMVIYKDGTVNMPRMKTISEINLNNVKLIFGGLGLVNKADKNFKYSPVAEGFKGRFADVLRTTKKTVIGYHEKEDKIYILEKYCSHGTLVNLCYEPDETKGYNFKYALSGDGGGSVVFNHDGTTEVYGDGRVINNIIGFNLN